MKTFPISKYIGTFPKGQWVFVKNFDGTYEQAVEEASKLEKQNPKTGRKKNNYRIWAA